MGRKAKKEEQPKKVQDQEPDEIQLFENVTALLRSLPKSFDSDLKKLSRLIAEEQELADERHEDDIEWKALNNELRLIGDIMPLLQNNIFELVLAELVKTMPKEQQEALAKRVVESTGKYLDSRFPNRSEDEVAKKIRQKVLGILQKENFMLRYMDVSTSFGAEAQQDGAEGSSPGL